MTTEDAFLRAILHNPADDTPRLVYADWLDEQGDDASRLKAEFLRLTTRLTEPGRTAGWRKARRKELQQLAAGLDTDWLAVVSKLKVENCAGKREDNWQARYPAMFEFVCDKHWNQLTPTDDQTVRFCDSCRENVHYCDTIVTARQHAAEGHCIAVDLGVIRRDGDLTAMQFMMLGRPSPESVRRDEELRRPDPVSEARERRKREARQADQP